MCKIIEFYRCFYRTSDIGSNSKKESKKEKEKVSRGEEYSSVHVFPESLDDEFPFLT